MNILDIKVMRGPNYWSNYRTQLIAMKLDIGQYEELPTDKIPGFPDRLLKLIPSLGEHHCSRGKKGGFTERLREGTWLGHVIEHVALELQCLAGMDCGYGRTRGGGAYGVYNVVFAYKSESAGICAAHAAVELVTAVAEKRAVKLDPVIDQLARLGRSEAFGPSTQSIVDEAVRRGIPVKRMDDQSLVRLGYGRNQQLFRATIMGTTSNLGVDLACCKWSTKLILAGNDLPVPIGKAVRSREGLKAALQETGFPVVVKPVDGNHGRGISIGLRSEEAVVKAFKVAQKISDTVIVEQYAEGDDYRFLLIDYKLVAVAKRTPASVIGDGQSTIRELIDAVNAHPDRGSGHEKCLTKIEVDRETKEILRERGLSLASVLPVGIRLPLKRTANLSTGGTATDMTDLVHPDNVFLAERVARLMQLNICGIDIMAKDVTLPFGEGNGMILEVNAAPGFRMHTHPSAGTPRNVASQVVDMLFPNNGNGRIPIVAVTGTNGKTTTTRLIAYLAQQAGKTPGYATSEGVYINGNLIRKGDCTGPASAEMVLRDPLIDFAVLECARGGILRAGLGFEHCDISIVTNISEDHLGLDGIETLEQYTRVKEVVAQSTLKSGHAILNADDDRVFNMKQELDCKVVLFSRSTFNPRIIEHCQAGGMAVIVENGYFVICNGAKKTRVLSVLQVPLTFGGTADFMVKNILPAIAAATLSGFSAEAIRAGLLSFLPSPELTPGRMNLFEFDTFNLLLDYAHNEGGFAEIERFMAQVSAPVKTCIIGATGDRRDHDIRRIGVYAARIFDEIIIRHDTDGRGRTNEEMTALLLEGIRSVSEDKPVHVISDESEAIRYAITHAQPGSFVFVCADHVLHSISLIRDYQQKFQTSHALQAS